MLGIAIDVDQMQIAAERFSGRQQEPGRIDGRARVPLIEHGGEHGVLGADLLDPAPVEPYPLRWRRLVHQFTVLDAAGVTMRAASAVACL